MNDFRGADGMLLIGASEQNADLQYVSGFLAPDPFAFVQSAEASMMLVSELEIDRARAQAAADRVLSITPFHHQAAQKSPPLPGALLYYGAVALALSEIGLERMLVPADFPLAAADSPPRRRVRAPGCRTPVLPAASPQEPVRAGSDSVRPDGCRSRNGNRHRSTPGLFSG